MLLCCYNNVDMQLTDAQVKKFVSDSGLIPKSDFDALIKKAEKEKKKIGDILLAEGKISETDFKKMEAYALGIPFVDLSEQKIDMSVLSMVPEPIARNYNIVAYGKSDAGLEVAMLDVDDLSVIDFIKKRSGLKILPRLTDSDSIKCSGSIDNLVMVIYKF